MGFLICFNSSSFLPMLWYIRKVTALVELTAISILLFEVSTQNELVYLYCDAIDWEIF